LITPCMSPPSCSVGAGASAGKRKSRAPGRAKRRYSPCDPTHAQATEPATKLGPPRYRSPVWAQETGACAGEKDHRVRLAARVFPVKRREPPLWVRSTFDDDEVLRVGPELCRVSNLHPVSGDFPVVIGRRLEGRILRGERLNLECEGVDRLLLIGDHALEVLHGRGEVVPQAVGECGEVLDTLLALLEARLDLLHPRGHVADLLNQRVARCAER